MRRGHDLRPRQGRLYRGSFGSGRVPSGQPGRYPPGARRDAADGHGVRIPDSQDGPPPRQHRRLAPRGARGGACRGARRTHRRPEGRTSARGRGQEHHRLRRLRRSRRHRRVAPRYRHRVAASQASHRGGVDRRDGQGAGDSLQPRNPAHQSRHETARGGPVGRRRGQVSDGNQVHRAGHQHHRLRRIRRARAGCRRTRPHLRNELDQEERASRKDYLDQPAGRGDGARRRSQQAAHQPRAQTVPRKPVARIRRQVSARQRGRGRGQEHHRVRHFHRRSRRDRRHGAHVGHLLGQARRGGHPGLQEG